MSNYTDYIQYSTDTLGQLSLFNFPNQVHNHENNKNQSETINYNVNEEDISNLEWLELPYPYKF